MIGAIDQSAQHAMSLLMPTLTAIKPMTKPIDAAAKSRRMFIGIVAILIILFLASQAAKRLVTVMIVSLILRRLYDFAFAWNDEHFYGFIQ